MRAEGRKETQKRPSLDWLSPTISPEGRGTLCGALPLCATAHTRWYHRPLQCDTNERALSQPQFRYTLAAIMGLSMLCILTLNYIPPIAHNEVASALFSLDRWE